MNKAKAVTAALMAAGVEFSNAISDGNLTGSEILLTIAAAISAYAITWRVPNRPQRFRMPPS